METLAGNWSQDDPQAAATWLTTQETGDVGDAMRRVMGNWAAQDAAGALSFIESQPVGELRDGATQSYLWMNRSMEGDAAVALAESIQDERSRARSIGMTARRWMETDEPAARAYLESTDAIDDSLKQRLLGAESEER
jgi:hypothetical protein